MPLTLKFTLIFNMKKFSNDASVLLQIVQRYDILLIQEVRDKSETSIDILVDAVNTDIGLVSELSYNTYMYNLLTFMNSIR